jgi:hypothetical protein
MINKSNGQIRPCPYNAHPAGNCTCDPNISSEQVKASAQQAREAVAKRHADPQWQESQERIRQARAGIEEAEAQAKAGLPERVRKSRNREVFSTYICVGESDLYDWNEMRRAVLKEIAFMQCGKENTKIPPDSPFKGQYEGWCYASQRKLANRIGCMEDYIQKCIMVFEKDGVIEVRRWTDPYGYPHSEYHINDAVVDAHHRPEDYMRHERKRPRRGGNTKPNAGSFRKGNRAASKSQEGKEFEVEPSASSAVATRSVSRLPPDSSAVRHPIVQPFATRSVSRFETAELASEGVELGSIDSGGSSLVRNNPASGLASAAAGAAELESSGVGSSNQKTNQNPIGQITKGKRALTNRDTYPKLYADWKKFGGRLPKCRRCQEIICFNTDEPAHVCEGYVPKYPTMDMEARQNNREDLLEAKREELRNSLSVFHAEEQ